jgi:hypothetical protein
MLTRHRRDAREPSGSRSSTPPRRQYRAHSVRQVSGEVGSQNQNVFLIRPAVRLKIGGSTPSRRSSPRRGLAGRRAWPADNRSSPGIELAMIGPHAPSTVHPIAAAGRVTAPSCSVVIESETRLTLAVKGALVEPQLAAAAEVGRRGYTHRGVPASAKPGGGSGARPGARSPRGQRSRRSRARRPDSKRSARSVSCGLVSPVGLRDPPGGTERRQCWLPPVDAGGRDSSASEVIVSVPRAASARTSVASSAERA